MRYPSATFGLPLSYHPHRSLSPQNAPMRRSVGTAVAAPGCLPYAPHLDLGAERSVWLRRYRSARLTALQAMVNHLLPPSATLITIPAQPPWGNGHRVAWPCPQSETFPTAFLCLLHHL